MGCSSIMGMPDAVTVVYTTAGPDLFLWAQALQQSVWGLILQGARGFMEKP
jgi:hypothetical protein